MAVVISEGNLVTITPSERPPRQTKRTVSLPPAYDYRTNESYHSWLAWHHSKHSLTLSATVC